MNWLSLGLHAASVTPASTLLKAIAEVARKPLATLLPYMAEIFRQCFAIMDTATAVHHHAAAFGLLASLCADMSSSYAVPKGCTAIFEHYMLHEYVFLCFFF